MTHTIKSDAGSSNWVSNEFIRLQLLCFEPAPLCFRLLEVPFNVEFFQAATATIFAGSQYLVIRTKRSESLIPKISAIQFNSIFLEFRKQGKWLQRANFVLSPNDPKWANTRLHLGNSRSAESARESFEWLQIRVAMHETVGYPSSLDCMLRCPEGKAFSGALRSYIDALTVSSLPMEYFGIGDFIVDESRAAFSSFANDLDRSIGGIQKNRGKFPRIHDIMICPMEQARKMGSMLDIEPTNVGGDGLPVGLLRMPEDGRWRERAAQRVSNYLLSFPRIESDDKFKYDVFSRKEYEELDVKGLVPRLTADEILHPIIQRKHQALLKLCESDVVVVPMHRELSNLIQSETDRLTVTSREQPSDIIHSYRLVLAKHLSPKFLDQIFSHMKLSTMPIP